MRSRENPCHQVPLQLATLGSAAVRYVAPGNVVTTILGAGKPLALLAYVCAAPARTVPKKKLADLMWPALPVESARHALRQTLWIIRNKLGPDAVLTNHDDVTITERVISDRTTFLDAVQTIDLESAVRLFGGEYLAGLPPISVDFEQWMDQERYRLRLVYRRTAEVVVRRRMGKGRFRSALELARQLHASDTRHLGGCHLLIETLLSAGDHVAARSEADALEGRFRRDGRPPDSATAALLRLVNRIPVESGSGGAMFTDLVGREREFQAAWSAWTEAQAGRTVHLHVSGGPGMGKTRLLRDLGQRLRATGATVVYLRANPGERNVNLAFAGDLTGKLGRLPGATGTSPGNARCLVALNPTLSTFFKVDPDHPDGVEALRQRSLAVGELLAAVAEENPVAVLLDDLHWSDGPSRRLLDAALGKVVDERLLFVTTGHWPNNQSFHWPASREIALSPLTGSQVEAMLAGIAPLAHLPWVGDAVDTVMRISGGTPLFVVETIQAAIAAGHLTPGPEGWRCPHPADLGKAIADGNPLHRRVHQLEPTLRWLLLTLAVAQRPISARLLFDAAGRRDERGFADLGNLERRGLIVQTDNGWAPAREEITELALETAPRGTIQTANRCLAHVLTEHEGSPDALARAASHWAAAGDRKAIVRAFRRWLAAKRDEGDRRSIHLLAQEYAAPIESLIGPAELITPEPHNAVLASIRRRMNLPSRMPTARAALLILLGAVLGFSAARLLRDAPNDPNRTMSISDSLFAREETDRPLDVLPVRWDDASLRAEITDYTPPR